MAKKRKRKPKGLSAGQLYLRRKGQLPELPAIPRPLYAPEPIPGELLDIADRVLAEARSGPQAEKRRAAQAARLAERLAEVSLPTEPAPPSLRGRQVQKEYLEGLVDRARSQLGDDELVPTLETLRDALADTLAGRRMDRQQVERVRQTVGRRERGVRPLDEWRAHARNEPLRARVAELYRLGLNISEISREVGVARARVRTILREEEPDANPRAEWRAQARNEPLRRRCVELRRGGANLSAISREVGVVRARVRTILREEGVATG